MNPLHLFYSPLFFCSPVFLSPSFPCIMDKLFSLNCCLNSCCHSFNINVIGTLVGRTAFNSSNGLQCSPVLLPRVSRRRQADHKPSINTKSFPPCLGVQSTDTSPMLGMKLLHYVRKSLIIM